MGRTEIEQRRAAVGERVRKSRTAVKERIGQAKRVEGTLATTNNNTTLLGNLQTPGTMVVKLDFRQPKKSNSSRKRDRLLADRRRKAVEKLQHENKNLKRKTERLYKQLQRKKTKNSTISSRTTSLFHLHQDLPPNPLASFQNQIEAKTPRSKVDAEIIDSGVIPSVILTIRNKLLFANALSEEIKVARKNTNDQEQQTIRNVISGNIKKYPQIKVLAKMTETDRRKLSKVKARSIKIRKLREKPLIKKGIPAKVLEIFGRDDNSRMMPEKTDAKMIEKGTPKIQKRILNDYLSNLYDEFASEYPEDRLSFPSFCRMGPSNYLLVNFTTRTACLCACYQNMALKLKSRKLLKIVDTQNLHVFVKYNTDTDTDALIREITETGKDKMADDIRKKLTYRQETV